MTSTRQLAAIMFTDMVGYTVLMGIDEQKAMELLKANREIQKPLIKVSSATRADDHGVFNANISRFYLKC